MKEGNRTESDHIPIEVGLEGRERRKIRESDVIALYGAEIWGWKKEERLDKIRRKYVKWILGLDRTTPNYIVTGNQTERVKLGGHKESHKI